MLYYTVRKIEDELFTRKIFRECIYFYRRIFFLPRTKGSPDERMKYSCRRNIADITTNFSVPSVYVIEIDKSWNLHLRARGGGVEDSKSIDSASEFCNKNKDIRYSPIQTLAPANISARRKKKRKKKYREQFIHFLFLIFGKNTSPLINDDEYVFFSTIHFLFFFIIGLVKYESL